ncbi:hypothetical protein PQR66_36150 [Paraburkholderia agricolaris]|uniref:Uncharacterized protein n=1 Tax=Paraburkholderia agricolaris TaxID=2152888 RepID=A0ABW9A075_9BURK
MTREHRKRHGLRTLGAALFALFGAGAHAQSQPVPAAQAPQAWVAYAHQVSQQFQSALEGESPEAQRFHAFFEQRAASAGSDGHVADIPPVLSIKAWFDASGHVVRVVFAPLGNQQANADLRTLLLEQSTGIPPRGMRQPLVVRLHLSDTAAGEVRNEHPGSLEQPGHGTLALAARRADSQE